MFKSYNFWIRLVAVLVLLLRIVGAEFGFSVDSGLIIDIATAIASVLVVLGVIQVPVEKNVVSSADDKKDENIKSIGGELVKTFEQIKEDILTVKEKIASGLTGEESVLGEIAVILDGIIESGEECEAENVVNEPTLDEGVVQVNGDISAVMTEQIENSENIIIETEATSEIIAGGEAGLGEESKQACVEPSGEVEPQIEAVNNEATLFDEDKFKTVVRRKIVEMFEKEIDVIMEEVLA